MEGNDAPEQSPGEKEGGKHREWPALVLRGATPADPTYRPIDENHKLYPLAAWAYHHSEELEKRSRDGLLEALGRAWPTRGRGKVRYVRGMFVSLLLKAGVPSKTIAEKWCLSRGDVTDLAAEFGVAARGGLERGIDVDGAGEPYDPATQHGRLLSLRRDVYAAEGQYPRSRTLIQPAAEQDLRAYIDSMVASDPWDLFFAKDWDWSSETEYRFLLRGDTNDEEFIDIRNALEAVIVGPRFHRVYRPGLYKLCEELGVKALEIQWEMGTPVVVRMLDPAGRRLAGPPV